MNRITALSATVSGLLLASFTFAQGAAPAGSTGVCKDGTYSSAASKQGACRGHHGVKEWFAAAPPSPKPVPSVTQPPAPAAVKPAVVAAKPAPAAAPVGAVPAGAAGICNDGSYSTAQSRQGACRGHQGVKEWFSEATSTKAVPGPVAAPAPVAAASKPLAYTPPSVAATGGGAGQVWVNKSTKVYHCPDDRWYGKTKEGAYMSESAATAAGYHADHGKGCKS
jgi:Protein of unknown function (DUF3761)